MINLGSERTTSLQTSRSRLDAVTIHAGSTECELTCSDSHEISSRAEEAVDALAITMTDLMDAAKVYARVIVAIAG